MSDPPIPDYPDSGLVRFFDRIEPPLTQGSYTFVADQTFPASIDGKSTNMPVQSEEKHFIVEGSKFSIDKLKIHLRSPPKNEQQVIPGGTLPKIVFQSKTLPWERIVDESDETKPWMTLLLITDDEFKQYCNKSSLTVPKPHDILEITRDFLKAIGPCEDELSLLAHALQVNPMDKELCGGDEDGLFSVVVGNRVPAQESTKYHVCLVCIDEKLDLFVTESDSVDYITEPIGKGNLDFSNSNTDEIPDMTAVYSGDLVDDIRERVGQEPNVPEPPTRIDPPQNPPLEFDPPKDIDKRAPGPSQRRTRRFSAFDLLMVGSGLDFATGHSFSEEAAHEFEEISGMTGTLASQINAPDGIYSGPSEPLILLDYWTFKTGDGGDFENKMKKLAVRRKESDSNDSGPNLTLYDLEGGTSSASNPSFYEPALLGNDMDPDVSLNSFIYTDVVEHDGITRPCLYRGPCIAVPTDYNSKSEPYVNSDDAKMLETDTGLDVIHHSAAFELGRLLALSSPSFVLSLTRWRRLNAHKKAVSNNLDHISVKYDLDISEYELSSIKSVLQSDALSKSSVIADSVVEEYKKLSEVEDIPTPLPDDPFWDTDIPSDFEELDIEITVDESIGEDFEIGGGADIE